MPLSQAEFEAILADDSKRIVGDVLWVRVASRSLIFEVEAAVESDAGWPLRVSGWYRPDERKLTLTLRYGDLRIVGLDFGRNLSHTNVGGGQVRGNHLHLWSEEEATAPAYAADRITAEAHQPQLVWQQFCAELRIVHLGEMTLPGDRT